MDTAAIATICATVITTVIGVFAIIANLRYIRSENSKVLKQQAEILADHTKILDRIERGQEKGFETLEKSLEIQTRILERIEGNTRT